MSSAKLTKNDFIDRLWQEELARQAAFIEARRQRFLPTAKNLRLTGETLEEWQESAKQLLATENELAEECRKTSRQLESVNKQIADDAARNQRDYQLAESAMLKANAELNRIKSCRPFIADSAETA